MKSNLLRHLKFILLLFAFSFTKNLHAQPDAFVSITTTGNYYVNQNHLTEFLVQIGNIGDQPVTDGNITLTPSSNLIFAGTLNCISAPGYNGESICPNTLNWDGVSPLTGIYIPEGAVIQLNVIYYNPASTPINENISLSASINNTDADLLNNQFQLSLKTKPQFTRKLTFKITAIPTSINLSNTFDLLFVRTSPYKWRDDTLSVPVNLSPIETRLGTQRAWGEVTTNANQTEVYISFDYSNPTNYWQLPNNHQLSEFHPIGTDHNINELLRNAVIEHMGFFNISLGAFPYQIYTDDSYLDLTYLLFDAKPYFQDNGQYLEAYDFLGVVNNYQRIGDLDMSLYPRNVEPDSFRCFFETPIYYRYTAVKATETTTIPNTNATARIRIHGSIDLYLSEDVLPVKLENFILEQVTNQIKIQWSTSTESNNQGFYIQYSENGNQWRDLQFVPSKGVGGQSHQTLSYEWNYLPYREGLHYFRLKQVDFDGNESYSSIKSIKTSNNALNIQIYPNPASDQITIKGVKPGSQISIINSQGNLLKKEVSQGITHNLSIAHLSSGMYILQIKYNQETSTNSFIKQ